MSIQYSDLRVLVVDDHMMMRTMISQNLKDIGFEKIDNATTGVDALTQIEAAQSQGHPFNIVLLDWHMPDKEGIDVLSECRNNKIYDNMAIIMLTAEQDEKNVLRAIETGATSYLVKPVSKSALQSNLDKVLQWLAKNGFVAKSPAKSSVDKTKDIERFYKDLEPVVSNGMKSIFSELFHIKIIPEAQAAEKENTHMVCTGALKEPNVTVVLRFFFDRSLLKPLLHQIYSPDHLEQEEIYQDAASEIVNILCGQVKYFLNSKGFSFEFKSDNLNVDVVEIDGNEPVLNIAFSLNEQQAFLIDLDVNHAAV